VNSNADAPKKTVCLKFISKSGKYYSAKMQKR
jgi:hypothetical protein